MVTPNVSLFLLNRFAVQQLYRECCKMVKHFCDCRVVILFLVIYFDDYMTALTHH